jgi:hypothetical protein
MRKSNRDGKFSMSILSDLQTKKLGLLELLAMGFDLYLRRFQGFLTLFCVTYLPLLIIYQSIVLNPPSNSILQISYSLFSMFLFLILGPVYTTALAILTEGYVLGERPQVDVAIRQVLSRILPLTGLNIRFFIIFYLRFLLLIIPGMIYAVNNGYFGLSFILRDQRGKAAFQYSRSLVKGNWWKVFFFNPLIFTINFGLDRLISKFLSSFIVTSSQLVTLSPFVFVSFVALGFEISRILLFLNLEFQKK